MEIRRTQSQTDNHQQNSYQDIQNQYVACQQWLSRYSALPLEQQQLYAQEAMYYSQCLQVLTQHLYYVPPAIPERAVPKKLSQNQKRKKKLREKQAELEQEKKEIGQTWARIECKGLIKDIEKLQQKIQKDKQSKKQKFAYLIEIHKEVRKAREKMGLLKAETADRKNLREVFEKHNINVRRNKKPSRIKQLVHLFKEKEITSKMRQNKTKEKIKNQDGFETDEENAVIVTQATKDKAQIIEYPEAGKLAGLKWNNILLRQWVDHLPSVRHEHDVLVFINKLAYQQAIKKLKQPLKFKKRITAGFNEVSRTLSTTLLDRRCQLLIVALNIIKNPFKDGTDSQVLEQIEQAHRQNIPVMHCSTRSKLGRAFVGKFGPRISIVSVINYQGHEEQFGNLMRMWNKLRQQYQRLKKPEDFLKMADSLDMQ